MEDHEMIQLKELRNMCDKLKMYAKLDGSELGEVCQSLISLAIYTSYVSKQLADALFNEIKEQLAWYEKNTKIIKVEKTRTETYSSLEWE